jgi:hypothetical protein
MFIKYCILAFVILSAVNCQNLRVRRQGTKGGYRPQSSVGAPQRQRPLPRPYPQEEEGQVNSAEGEANPEPPIYGGVMGVPGVDFPGYTQIPKTNFKCSGVPYEPGMYADQETQCQAYHVCFQGRKESFLCGVGTVFNQAILGCDYWHSVDCSASPNFYSVNEELGKAGPEPGPGQAAVRPAAPRPYVPTAGQRPSAPRPRPPVPSIQRPEFEEPYVEEPQVPQQPRPQPPRFQPSSKVQPNIPQRPQYKPPTSKVNPAVQQRPYPQPAPQQRPIQQRPYQPQPQPQPLPPPRPVQPIQRPIGKPSLPRPRPSAPIVPQRPIVQTQEEEPVDDSWLSRESSQRQESSGY